MKDESKTGEKTASIFSFLLFAFGLVQILGYAFDSSALRGIGAAFMVSPLPKVFSDVAGLETFASEFMLVLEHTDGSIEERQITPEFYSQLQGPYKRRNAYGAALSYAPRLPESLWRPVFSYGFNGPLRTELGLPGDLRTVKVSIRTRTKGRSDSWILEAK